MRPSSESALPSPPSQAAPDAAPQRASPRERWAASLLVVVATALAYSNTLDASFHLDDLSSIVVNPALRDLGALWPPSGPRGIGYLTFALNYRAGGLEVAGYHAVNVLVHAANALLVLALAAATLRTPALRRARVGPLVARFLPLAAALLFALHPLATQAVTYVVQRLTSLATLFYLLAIVSYARARLALDARGRWTPGAAAAYALSLAAAVAAMHTKEIAVTLPVAAAAYEVLFFGRSRRAALLAPLAATALLVPLALGLSGRELAAAIADPRRLPVEAPELPRGVYLLTETRVVATYLRLLVLPVGQSFDPDVELSRSIAEARVLAALALLLAVAGAAALLLRRARRAGRAEGVLVFFGVAWFFLGNAVESSVFPIRDVMFEHRAYLPSVGFALAAATLLLSAAGRLRAPSSPALRAATALLLTAGPLGAATFARNAVWKDELSLWSDAAAKSPGKARPHEMLGIALRNAGRLGDAERELRAAIRLDPESTPEAHNDLGCVLNEQGRTAEAIEEFRKAIALRPMPEILLNLVGALEVTGRRDEAIAEYERFLAHPGGLDPRYAEIMRGHLARLRPAPPSR